MPIEEGKVLDVARGIGLKALKAGAYALGGTAIGASLDHLAHLDTLNAGTNSIIDDFAVNPLRDTLGVSGLVAGMTSRRKVHENRLENNMTDRLEEGLFGKVRLKDRPTGGRKPKGKNLQKGNPQKGNPQKMEEDIQNLINLAIESKPVEFSEQLNRVLSTKATEILEATRLEIAQNLYSRQVNLENI